MDNPDISKQLKNEQILNTLNLEYINCLESFIMNENSEFKKFTINEKIKSLKKAKEDLVTFKNKDYLEEFLSFIDYPINSNDLFFASSKTKMPKNFKINAIKSNYIKLSNDNINITLFEYKEFLNIDSVFNNHYSEYLKKNKENIIENTFYIKNTLIKKTLLLENEDFFINYWFIKNNKLYRYQINFRLLLDSIIQSNIKKEDMPNIITLDESNNKMNIHLKEYGEFANNNDILNMIITNYISANNNSPIIKNNFTIDKYPIEKTLLMENNLLFINYWFVKGNNAYRYQIHYNLLEFDDLIIELIDSTSPGITNLQKLFAKNFLNNDINNTLSIEDSFNILNSFKNEISIIIPINNNPINLKDCVESIYENTSVKFKLYLINNNPSSYDSSILKNYEKKYDNLTIINNFKKNELIKTINKCIKLTNNDIVLMECDNILTPKWDQKFLFSAYIEKNIATVSPLTNIDIPSQEKINFKSPSTINKFSKFIENISIYGNIESTMSRNFCLFIKRDALDDINYFNEEKPSNNEWKVDFDSKIYKKGWKHVLNDSIFIHNKTTNIFSLNKTLLNTNILNLNQSEEYDNILKKWKKFIKSKKIKNLLSFIEFELNFHEKISEKKNILYVTDLNGKHPLVDNKEDLSKEYNIFCLTLEKKHLKLWMYSQDKFMYIKEMPFLVDIPNLSELNLFYVNLFKDFKIDLVFIRFSKTFGLNYCQDITPMMFSSMTKTPIYYGRSTEYLINQLENSLKTSKKNNIKFKNEKGVVYTAIFGNYESLLDPKIIDPNLDYICFTDNPNLNSDVWKIQLIDDLDLDNTRKARTLKTLPHKYLKEYDFSIWVDAAFLIVGDLEEYVNKFSVHNLFLGINHSWRDCIYEESKAILELNKDNEEVVTKQINRYRLEGFPENIGLIESGILFRRHNNSTIIKLMNEWNYEVINFSKRDQLSLNYVFWKNNFSYDKVPIFYWANQFFDHYHHTKLANNNKVTIPFFRILLIDEENLENTKKSLDAINNINNNIPITIISHANYDFLEDYNINNYKLNKNESVPESINRISENITEDFIIIIKSGDIIQYSLIEEFMKIYKQKDIRKISCMIFDEIEFIEDNLKFHFKPNFSQESYLKKDYNNKAILNREILLLNGGFGKDKSFVNTYLSKIHPNYEILHLNEFGLKFGSFKKLYNLNLL